MESKIRVLAIDFGTKVTGLAVFLEGEDFRPHPFGRIITQEVDLVKKIVECVQENSIETIVIGLPTMPDGRQSEQAKLVQKFGSDLEKALSHKQQIIYQDEAYTTYEAEERMKESPEFNFKVDVKKLDEISALIILEDWLAQNA